MVVVTGVAEPESPETAIFRAAPEPVPSFWPVGAGAALAPSYRKAKNESIVLVGIQH